MSEAERKEALEETKMQIRRTWTARSLRAGQEEIIDEARAREIISLTMLGRHPSGRCGKEGCDYCPEPAMQKLLKGEKLQQFFCDLELISTEGVGNGNHG